MKIERPRLGAVFLSVRPSYVVVTDFFRVRCFKTGIAGKNIFKGERDYLARKSSTKLPFSQNGKPCEIFKMKKTGGLNSYYKIV